MDKYFPPDDFLPESYTCFFLLKLPRYSSKEILKAKLTYAIHFCKSIDTDDYARIALSSDLPGDTFYLVNSNNNDQSSNVNLLTSFRQDVFRDISPVINQTNSIINELIRSDNEDLTDDYDDDI